MLDLYARQAADFIAHVRSREAAKIDIQRKDEFLATLAHELRNPLAPIRTGLELIKMADDKAAIVEKVLGTMERQTQHLVRLVDDLLDMSRITRGKLELRTQQVALADVVKSALEASRPFIDQTGHELAVTFPNGSDCLKADPQRLTQVIANLLNNAAKYTPPGGQIHLSAERIGSDVVVTVKDNGVGIPADKLERVFEIFTQIGPPQGSDGSGIGIGLTLVKSIVEMHGGSVRVYSEGLNKGSMFVVRLPISDEPADAASALPQPTDEVMTLLSRKVLVVDDNHDAATMLSKIIQMLGHEVRIATNGKEACELAAEFHPDVILMDIGMPILNGYDAAQRIREEEWGKDITLVAMTGYGQEDDRHGATEAASTVISPNQRNLPPCGDCSPSWKPSDPKLRAAFTVSRRFVARSWQADVLVLP